MTAICPVCGKQIKQEKHVEGGRPKRFCSPRCRGIYHCRASQARKRGAEVGPDGHPLRPGRKCSVCGKEIDPRKVEGTVCCSDACSQKRSNRLRYGLPVGDDKFRAFCENRKAERLAKRKRVCPVCGKEFMASVEGHPGRTKLTCSDACKWKRINRLREGQPVAETEYRELVEKRKTERLAKLQRVCPVCGKAFVADAAHPGRKFCSIACANRARAGIKHAAKPTAKPAAKPNADQAYEASLARVRAYLKLPARARWANRGMLTATELRMDEQMWENGHGGWNVHYNTIR